MNNGKRVYDVDSITKTVTLMAADPTESTLTLSGTTGWKNAVSVLNSVGSIFGQGDGAVEGRSIQKRDISAHSNYSWQNYKNGQHTSDGINQSSGGTVDNSGYYVYTGNESRIETQEYTNGTFVMDDNSEITATVENPVTMKQTYYGYAVNGNIVNPYKDLLIKQSLNVSEYKSNYWIASRYVDLYPTLALFRVGYLYYNDTYGMLVSGPALFYSHSNNMYSFSYGIVPMVTLQSNIKVTGQDANNVWQLDIE